METLLQNLRYAIRVLRKSPGFTAAALLTLALAIVANTAIFSVVDAVVLRALPYRDPDRLVLMKEWIPQAAPDPIPVSAPVVIQFQRQNSVFDGVAAVVGDVKQGALDEDTALHTYAPFLQQKSLFNSLNVTVRAVGEPAELASSLRAAIWGLDDQLAVAQVRTMDEIVGESTAPRRINLYLLAGFAVTARMLAAIGIYGVIAYSVGRRTQEIGIRLALGAGRFDVLLLILKPGFALTLAGTGLGIAAALALIRLMSAMLFGVRPTDPLTFAAVSVVLVLVSLLASYIPARRAAKVDPMVALRYE